MNNTTLKIIDTIAILFAQAYLLFRSRLTSHPSPIVRLQAMRDHFALDAGLLKREVEVFRSQRVAMNSHQRPEYSPTQRFEILQIMRLREWNAVQTAEHFVLHPNTIRSWIKAMNNGDIKRLLGGPVWNRIHDAVRWTVHELRRLFPDPDFGIRTIDSYLVRTGVQISPSSVQRIMREDKPNKPRSKPPLNPPEGIPSHHLLRPKQINRVWHLDLCSLRILWMKFTVAAILDGYSRKLLILKVYRGAVNTRQMVRLVRKVMIEYGRPRFLITDHGCQFRTNFKNQIEKIGIQPVQGKVRSPSFNGKIERLFRTLRRWHRLTLLPINIHGLQRRFDHFRDWYNQERPHAALNARTPEEAWKGTDLPEPIPIRQRDLVVPIINVCRKTYADDPCLPIVDVTVNLQFHQAA